MTDIVIVIRRSGEDPDEAATLRLNDREHTALANVLDYAENSFGNDLDSAGRTSLSALANTLMAARRPGDSSAEDPS
jgi:hypothetical protein